jgi:ubiquitin-protein ligase
MACPVFPVWFGVLFVRQGVYQGGIFRFCIHIPEGFPDGGCPVSLSQFLIFIFYKSQNIYKKLIN